MMRSVGNDIDEAVVRAQIIEMVSLEELLKISDFVSVNCDLNPSSRHLLDREALAMMKPDAVLINTARVNLLIPIRSTIVGSSMVSDVVAISASSAGRALVTSTFGNP